MLCPIPVIRSDYPEVHSNGFHFGLDKEFMIIPKWVPSHDSEEKRTTIRLPLNDEMRMKVDQLQRTFLDSKEMSALLLLFLTQLRSITIIDKLDMDDSGEVNTRRLRRVDGGNGVWQLHDNKVVREWFIARRAIEDIGALRGKTQVDKTEVAIAVPMDDDVFVRQDVFAFLPVDDYGFRFVVQADFLLTSSREKVTNVAWNEMLRDQIFTLFIDVVEKTRDRDTEVSADQGSVPPIAQLLRRLPMANDLIGFFKPVAKKLRDALQDVQCVPAEGGTWCRPRDIVRASAALKRLVSSQLLQDRLQLQYLRADIETSVESRVLDSLGVQHISPAQLVDLLACVVPADAEAPPSPSPHCSALWVGQLVTHLYGEGVLEDGSSLLARLKGMYFLPLQSGGWANLDGSRTIFRSSQKMMSAMAGFQQEIPTVHLDFFGDPGSPAVAKVNRALGQLGVEEASSRRVVECHIIPAFEADTATGIPARTIVAYLAFLVGQVQHLKESVKLKLGSVLVVPVAHPEQVVQHAKKADKKDHDRKVWQWVSNGVRRVRCDEHDVAATGVHLVASDKANADRLRDWSCDNLAAAKRAGWCALDCQFLAQHSALSAKRWEAFFLSEGWTGVLRSFVVSSSKWAEIVPTESPWDVLELGTETRYGQDHVSAELDAVLTNLAGTSVESNPRAIVGIHFTGDGKAFSKRTAALKIVEGIIWENADAVLHKLVAKCSPSQVRPSGSAVPMGMVPTKAYLGAERAATKQPAAADVKRAPSSLARTLRGCPWLVANTSGHGDRSYRMFAPSVSFFDSEEVTAVGGGHLHTVAYGSDVPMKKLMSKLGVKDRIDGACLLALLRAWASEDNSGGSRFSTSVSHFVEVLRHAQRCLHDDDGAQALRKAFSEEPLIWLPDISVDRRAEMMGGQDDHGASAFTEKVDGQFWRACDVTWTDPSNVLDLTDGPPRVAGLHYGRPNLDGFFNKSLCFSCRKGGYGTKGAPGCNDCEKSAEIINGKKKKRYLDRHSRQLEAYHFACGGDGTSLIPYMATVQQYVQSLAALANRGPEEAQLRVRNLLEVLSIGLFMQEMPEAMHDAMPSLFREQPRLFPARTAAGWVWASLADLVLVNDDDTLGTLFADHRDLHLLQFGFSDPAFPLTDAELSASADTVENQVNPSIWFQRPHFDLLKWFNDAAPDHSLAADITAADLRGQCIREAQSLRPLLRHLGVPRLSSKVKSVVRPHNPRAEPRLMAGLLTDACLVVQRWIHANDPAMYAQAIENNAVGQLLDRLQLITVDSLVLEHTLTLTSKDNVRKQPVDCHLSPAAGAEGQANLYVSRALLPDDSINATSNFWKEFVRMFFDGRPHHASRGALVRLLEDWEGMTAEKRESYLVRADVSPLPADAGLPWVLPLPSDEELLASAAEASREPSAALASAGDAADEDVETFTGGFDKIRAASTRPKPVRVQFPAPAVLETVVAEEDDRIRTGRPAPGGGPPSNVIYAAHGSFGNEPHGEPSTWPASGPASARQIDEMAPSRTASFPALGSHGSERTRSGPRPAADGADVQVEVPDPRDVVALPNGPPTLSADVLAHTAPPNYPLPHRPGAAVGPTGFPGHRGLGHPGFGHTNTAEGIEILAHAGSHPFGSAAPGLGGVPALMPTPEEVAASLTVRIGAGSDFPIDLLPAVVHGDNLTNRNAVVVGRLGEEAAFSVLLHKAKQGTATSALFSPIYNVGTRPASLGSKEWSIEHPLMFTPRCGLHIQPGALACASQRCDTHTRCGTHYTSCAYLLHADWCLRSDFMTNSPLQAHFRSLFSALVTTGSAGPGVYGRLCGSTERRRRGSRMTSNAATQPDRRCTWRSRRRPHPPSPTSRCPPPNLSLHVRTTSSTPSCVSSTSGHHGLRATSTSSNNRGACCRARAPSCSCRSERRACGHAHPPPPPS